jgi:arylsulfatase A-like enzyme
VTNVEKPNVLFIPIDDLRPQLGCYGRDGMVTPHVDRLARGGVVFTRSFCQVPVCGATRASLLSGVRPARDRFTNWHTWVDEDLPGALTLPQHFRNHGYVTLSDGKVFHHREDAAERSWSEEPWHPNVEAKETWRNYALDENRALDQAQDHRGPPYERADVPDKAYFDGQIADRAVADLHRLAAQDEPFFLAAGFLKPHLPFNAPARYWDYYDRDQIELADNPFRPHGAPDEAMHNWGELRNYFDVPREGPLSDEMARTLIHGYYAATSFTDAQVGRLLGELDALGLRENTVIVLWGDHGWQLGEHGLWCKHCNFETSLNAPLIVSAPWMRTEQRCDALVEFVDIYPTLCELAGLPLPEHLEGTSFVPLMEDPGRPWKPAAFCRYQAGDSIRTDRYLYTEWTDNEGERTARMLYDHKADPHENENVSERPEHADLVARLSDGLRRGWRDAGSSLHPLRRTNKEN